MKFLVDSMLGGLARWLRILGHDVTYDSKSLDSDLLIVTQGEKRILLTRDEELYHRAIARQLACTLVLGETEVERLAQMAGTFGLSLEPSMDNSKCPECGSDLRESSKEEVSTVVPFGSLRLYDEFWRCTNQKCGKAYWIGSHWSQMRRTLSEAMRRADLRRWES